MNSGLGWTFGTQEQAAWDLFKKSSEEKPVGYMIIYSTKEGNPKFMEHGPREAEETDEALFERLSEKLLGIGSGKDVDEAHEYKGKKQKCPIALMHYYGEPVWFKYSSDNAPMTVKFRGAEAEKEVKGKIESIMKSNLICCTDEGELNWDNVKEQWLEGPKAKNLKRLVEENAEN